MAYNTCLATSLEDSYHFLAVFSKSYKTLDYRLPKGGLFSLRLEIKIGVRLV